MATKTPVPKAKPPVKKPAKDSLVNGGKKAKDIEYVRAYGQKKYGLK